MKLDIETWVSDKGNSEVHHFIAGTQTYVFGVNKELLGEELCAAILWMVEHNSPVYDPGPKPNGYGYFNTVECEP